jgi:putative DNA primase/helicase
MSVNYDNIPEEMRSLPQWVCYRLEPNEEGRPIKVPYQSNGGARAASNDPSTWNVFEHCLAVFRKKLRKPYNGIGYIVSSDDPYTLIDLDNCVDDAGNIEDWAKRILSEVDSYAERSQSGKGIHIIAKASKPGPRCRCAAYPGIEMYDNRRFVVMTGNVLPGNCATIQPAANEVAALYHRLFAEAEMQKEPDKPKGRKAAAGPQNLSDQELIDAIISSKAGPDFSRLWNGDTSDYNGDDSAADIALCNHLAWWTNGDAERMDRLFRQSGLMRDKWGRADYCARTLSRAINDCKGGYSGHSSKSSAKKRGKKSSGEASEDNTPRIYHMTDAGNAERLIDAHGNILRYNVDSGKWLLWNDHCWEPNSTYAIDRLALETIRSIYDELRDIEDPDQKKKWLSHIIKSESSPRLAAMVSIARTLEGVAIHNNQLDSDQWALNCLNGTIDLRTGELHPHEQADLISKIVQIEYDSKAKCKRWLQFLNEVFINDADLVSFARRMIGYCLTGDTREESVFILLGKGSCGKSKFTEVLRYILGTYTEDTPVTTFVERKDQSTADLAKLAGARLVTATEAEETQTFNEGLLKRISGRDPVTCRHLYREFFTYIPTYKVLFATNEVPRIKSQNFAMKRRLKIVPFHQHFYDPSDGKQPVKDDQILSKLLAELPGILTWAVEGCLEWQRNGLAVPKVIKDEIDSLFESQDPLSEWIDECCSLDPAMMTEISNLWKSYLEWCDNNNRKAAFKQTNWFSRNLAQRDEITPVKGLHGKRFLRGITFAGGGSGVFWDDSGKCPHEGNGLTTSETYPQNTPPEREIETNTPPFGGGWWNEQDSNGSDDAETF